ncbi:MAG: hypothetical protein CMK92_06535, partial [Pseudomonas sp.]|nr:hypothetical protein [Pseudomonas sp.]
MKTNLTRHASERKAQRGFNSKIINFLLRYGERISVKGKASKVFIKKKELESLVKDKKVTIEEKLFIKKNYERLSKKALILSESMVLIT